MYVYRTYLGIHTHMSSYKRTRSALAEEEREYASVVAASLLDIGRANQAKVQRMRPKVMDSFRIPLAEQRSFLIVPQAHDGARFEADKCVLCTVPGSVDEDKDGVLQLTVLSVHEASIIRQRLSFDVFVSQKTGQMRLEHVCKGGDSRLCACHAGFGPMSQHPQCIRWVSVETLERVAKGYVARVQPCNPFLPLLCKKKHFLFNMVRKLSFSWAVFYNSYLYTNTHDLNQNPEAVRTCQAYTSNAFRRVELLQKTLELVTE